MTSPKTGASNKSSLWWEQVHKTLQSDWRTKRINIFSICSEVISEASVIKWRQILYEVVWHSIFIWSYWTQLSTRSYNLAGMLSHDAWRIELRTKSLMFRHDRLRSDGSTVRHGSMSSLPGNRLDFKKSPRRLATASFSSACQGRLLPDKWNAQALKQISASARQRH